MLISSISLYFGLYLKMNMNFNSYNKYQIVTKFLSDGLAVLVTFKTKAERDPVSVRSTPLDPMSMPSGPHPLSVFT